MSRFAALAVVLLCLVACQRNPGDTALLERIDLAPADLVVYGEGDLTSATPTSLAVRGKQ